AALQVDDAPSRLDEALQLPGEVGVVARRELQPGERIAAVGVEPGRQDQPRRLPLLDDGTQHLVDGEAVRVSRRAPGEREVDGGALALAPTHLLEGPGARI